MHPDITITLEDGTEIIRPMTNPELADYLAKQNNETPTAD